MTTKVTAKKRLVEHKAFHIDGATVEAVKSEGEDGKVKRTISGYASFFGNVDSYGDVVQKGAFKKTLNDKNRGRKVKFLYQHNPYEPIGIPTDIVEDDKGLRFSAEFADTERGEEAYELARIGALDGLSIGFRTIDSEYNSDTGIRTLVEIDLMEVSLVTFEANTKAKVTDVKNDKASLHAQVIAGLVALGHTSAQAVEAIKSLSLDPEEPEAPDEDADHSAGKADSNTPTEEAEGDEVSRKALDVLHSLRSIKSTITPTKG